MTVEREVKLAASPAFRMPALADVLEGVRAVRLPDRTLHTVYFDAADLRLLRWGASLRYREEQGWTVKLPRPETGSALVREEVSFPGDGGIVPNAALDLLRGMLRTADVEPVLQLRTDRRTIELRDGVDSVLAEVADDEVVVVSGLRRQARFRELEVEQREEGLPGLLEAVVARLRAAGAGEPDPTPKPVRALGPRATAPADVVVGPLPAEPTMAEVVRRAIAASVVHLVRHDPILRLDNDPEGVHQARVATRRLRSDLRTFAPLLEPGWLAEVRGQLRWLGDALAQARDTDVLLERLRRTADRLDAADVAAAAQVIQGLELRDKEAHASALAVMTSDRYAGVLDLLVEAANAPMFASDPALPAADIVPRLVRRPWKALRRSVLAAGRDPADEQLHGIRIRAKRARYAAEAAAPVVGKPAQRFAKATARLQDVLGEHQDAVVAAGWLRTWAADQDSRDVAFVAGVLAGLEEAAADRTADRWRTSWEQVDRMSLRGWM